MLMWHFFRNVDVALFSDDDIGKNKSFTQKIYKV